MDQAFNIREYGKSDFRVYGNRQKCFPGDSYSEPELLFYMRRPRAFTLVAELANQRRVLRTTGRVSFIVAEAGRAGTSPLTCSMNPAALGLQLMAAAEQRLRSEGCQSVILETAVDNASALAFYKRHQYFLVKTVTGYYATGVDALVLKKDLLTEA
jgi:hypothetical protein